MKNLFFLSALLLLVTDSASAANIDIKASFPEQSTCPLIAKGSKSPSTFACAQAGTHSCCTHENGIAVLANQWLPNRGAEHEFTVHGLWPNTCSNGRTPDSGCDRSRQYKDMTSLLEPGMLEQMNMYWPSKFDDYNKFWVHEWGKHGTCMSTLSPECFSGNPQYRKGMEVNEYFKAALKLRKEYEPYRALSKAGIVASLDRSRGGFTVKDVVAAIRKEYGVDVQVKCQANMVYEIVMYFAPQGRDGYVPIDVPEEIRHKCGKPNAKLGLPPKNMSEAELLELKESIGYDLSEVIKED